MLNVNRPQEGVGWPGPGSVGQVEVVVGSEGSLASRLAAVSYLLAFVCVGST